MKVHDSEKSDMNLFEVMSETGEELKLQFKKINQQATSLKMDLHDLAENLPADWEKIPEIAEKAYEAHRKLAEIREKMRSEA